MCDSSMDKIASSRSESTKAGEVKPGVVVSSNLQYVSHCSFGALRGSGESGCTESYATKLSPKAKEYFS